VCGVVWSKGEDRKANRARLFNITEELTTEQKLTETHEKERRIDENNEKIAGNRRGGLGIPEERIRERMEETKVELRL